MNEVYSVLFKFGPEWDAQRVFYVKNKEFFDLLVLGDNNVVFNNLSDTLKEEIRQIHTNLDNECPYAPEPLDEEMSLSEMLWNYFDYSITYPVIVLGYTEYVDIR